MTIQFEGLALYMLVFARFAGMLALNPLLARRNIPATVRTTLTLFLTFLVAPTLTANNLPTPDGFDIIIKIILELFVGFVCGFVFQIFYDMLLFAGDILDTEFGMSMAKVFDPGSNMQMSVTGKFLTFIFVAYFFLSGSHLVVLHLFAQTFEVVAPGAIFIKADVTMFVVDLFSSAFSLIMRLVIPFIAAELILQIALGIMMKLVPQIHVFVINFQLKQGVGLLLLLLLAPLISTYISNYIVILQDTLQQAIQVLA